MAQTAPLGEAQVPIRATTSDLERDLQGARGKIESAMSTIGSIAIAGAAAAVTAITGVVTGAAVAIGKLAIDAAPVEGMSKAFSGLSESAGRSAGEMMSALQEGSNYMITQESLMGSFNKAAQLVGVDFAVQLPDAMRYLGKVASATGQDMGFMMDSLVVGVGRLSPMILDNLGVQVSLAEATARSAEMYGVEEEALTKAQLQAGMMSVTLEKLATNTAAMPDVTETAAAKLAQWKTRVEDTKDAIGLKFLPVLGTVMDTLGTLADMVMPVVMDALDMVAPIAEKVADGLGNILVALFDAGPGSIEFKEALTSLIPEEVVDKIYEVVDGIQAFLDKASEALQPVTDWISENVKLQDILIALSIAIATAVVPAIWSVVTAAAPIIAVFAGVVAAIAILRSAWENDFLGGATRLKAVWAEISPAFQAMWEWLQINIPAAIAAVSEWWNSSFIPALQAVWDFIQVNIIPVFVQIAAVISEVVGTAVMYLVSLWQTVLLPALQAVWAFIQESIIPIFIAVGEAVGGVVGGAVTFLSGLWTTVLLPALQAVWGFITESIWPLFQAFGEFISTVFNLALTVLAGLWQNVLFPALETVYEVISAKLQPVFDGLQIVFGVIADVVTNVLLPAIADIVDWVGTQMVTGFDNALVIIQTVGGWLSDKLAPAFEGVKNAISGVIGFIEDMTTALKNINLPDWLTPGSPTPFEIGLVGIGDAMNELNTLYLPKFEAGLNIHDNGLAGAVLNQAPEPAANGRMDAAQIVAAINRLPDAIKLGLVEAMATLE